MCATDAGFRGSSKRPAEEGTMPMYEYECQTCKKVFTLALSFNQHDHNRVTCPGCQSSEVRQLISSFIAKTASKT